MFIKLAPKLSRLGRDIVYGAAVVVVLTLFTPGGLIVWYTVESI